MQKYSLYDFISLKTFRGMISIINYTCLIPVYCTAHLFSSDCKAITLQKGVITPYIIFKNFFKKETKLVLSELY